MAKQENRTLPQKKVDSAIEKLAEGLKEKKVDNTNKKVISEIIIHRELKYNYPRDCKDTLSRKAFRQKVRNELRKFDRDIKDAKGEEKAALKQKLEERKKVVLAS